MSAFDYSTITLSALRALPVYRLPRWNHFGEGIGGGLLYPPGYPNYFTREVLNRHDNPLQGGPDLVITDPDDQKTHYIIDDIDLRTLWTALPWMDGERKTPRIQSWEIACYRSWTDCYYDPEAKVTEIFIGNIHAAESHPLVTVENHYAVHHIRTFYPDYQPEAGLIYYPPKWTPTPGWQRDADYGRE